MPYIPEQKWAYSDPADPVNGNFETITVIMSEREIIEGPFYPWWAEQMRRIGKADLISEANCIEDWVVVNWAWKV